MGIIVDTTGVAGTGHAGSVSTTASAVVTPTGVSATGATNIANVWGLIDQSQTPNYSTISTSQTPSYSAVSTSQTPDWKEVA